MLPVTTPHASFTLLRQVDIAALNATLCEYRHDVTGARHLHLAADNPENVFLVAFKTMPEDSTGVAHILEHTVLCGSERFPVRDPFFLMIRRSLNTFMNAFTASDWTAYPFASQNRQDYDNLLGVYLDAVFFPHLHPLDFAQEGIRVEFADAADERSALVWKGVVYNEMKGAMSPAHSVLHETLYSHLFPTTTYHYNSGGDPAHIPDLTHEALLAFHRRHYHPSNAVFMTYGDRAPADLQARFHALALQRFDSVGEPVSGRDEKRRLAPLRVEEAYAPESADGPQTHHVLAWLLGASADVRARFEAHLLSGVLLENAASPLRHALETTELGEAPTALMGLDDQGREMSFIAGIEGSEPEHAAAVEALILDTLQQVAEQGVALAEVEAVLHQFELSQREIGGDSYPYGLQLLLNGLTPYLQDSDPLAVWDIEAELAHLRQAILDPAFVPGLVRRLLLDNPHRVRLTLRPDDQLAARRDAHEAERLAAIKSGMSAPQLQQVREQAEALAARQAQENDVSLLPRVTLADVPAQVKALEGESHLLRAGTDHALPVATYAQGTNGLFYQQLIIQLPALTDAEVSLLPLYTSVFSELGVGEADYRVMQQRQSAVSGGLRMSLSGRTSLDSPAQAQVHLVVSGKALGYRQAAFQALLHETFARLRFDEPARVRDLLAQLKTRWEGSITGQGHGLAMQAAARSFSALAAFQQRHSGLAGIAWFKQLHDGMDEAGSQRLLADLATLHAKVQQAPRQFLLIGESGLLPEALETLNALWPEGSPVASGPWLDQPVPAISTVQEAWLTQTQVQFCARAFPAVPIDHDDAPALMALGSFLRNGYLHRAIREQGGAYGGGASYDSNACAFRFYSYRDPRFQGTLEDFDRSLDWLLSTAHRAEALEEAQLGLFADMDKPLSPAGEARQAFHNQLYGRTVAQRQRLRERLLGLEVADLTRVAARYLTPAQASTVVIAPAAQRDAALSLGLTVRSLQEGAA